MQGAHKAVFDEAPSVPQVIDWGVFSHVRHPMYLGVLLFLLGLFFWSLSLLSICIWVGFFLFARAREGERGDPRRIGTRARRD